MSLDAPASDDMPARAAAAGAPAALTPDVPAASTPLEPPLLQRRSASAAVEKTVRVMIRLSDGDRVDGGGFANADDAIERAKALIHSIEAESGSEWPFLNGRFLRPETIVSVDLVEERPRF